MVAEIQNSKTLRALIAGTLFFGFFLFTQLPPKVSAVSAYDDALKLTNPELRKPGNLTGSAVCYNDQTRMLNDWYSELHDERFDGTSTVVALRTQLNDLINDSTSGGWAMTSQASLSTFTTTLRLTVWNGSGGLTWSAPDGTYADGRILLPSTGLTNRNLATITLSCSPFSSVGQIVSISVSPWSSSQLISGDTAADNNRLVFLSGGTTNFAYPVGYAGLQIRENSVLNSGTKTYADFDVQIEAFDITATYRGTQYDDPKCTVLIWRFVNSDEPFAINQQTTKINDSLKITAPTEGTYRLDVTWAWRITQMDTVGLNPADEAYCTAKNTEILSLYSEGKLPSDTGKVFLVDGLSSIFLGYDANRECFYDSEAGNGFGQSTICVYSTDPILEDCSVYGATELHTRIGCELGNLYTNIRFMFTDMWSVRPYFVSNRLSDFNSHVQSNTSILTYPAVFVSQVVSATASSSTSCPAMQYDFMGTTTNIDMCSMETQSPATWTFIQVAATSIFAFMFVTVLLGAYHRLWSTKE